MQTVKKTFNRQIPHTRHQSYMQNYNIIKIPQKTYLKNAADFVDTIFVGNLSAFNISCHSCCLLKYTQYDKKNK